jgi:MtN3 and saliva related transmembrane protein
MLSRTKKEKMATIFFILATLFGTLSAIANFPQAWRIFKRKSAGDISIWTYSLLFVGAITWILYGFEINNFPIVITNIVGGANIFLVILGWFFYGREKRLKGRKNAQK